MFICERMYISYNVHFYINRTKALKWHPDKHLKNKKRAAEKFREVSKVSKYKYICMLMIYITICKHENMHSLSNI